MPELRRSALLPLAVEDVYAIVTDVGRYPEFLPWCRSASVLVSEPRRLVATLVVAGRGFAEQFTTTAALTPPRSIRLGLVEGPFRHFSGEWRFAELGGGQGCRVELDLSFRFSGAKTVLARAFAGVFSRAADSMVDAFCRRAHDQLGHPAPCA